MKNLRYCYNDYGIIFKKGYYYEKLDINHMLGELDEIINFNRNFGKYFLTQAQDRERKINEILL